MGPIDYSSQVQDPFQAAAQGYQFGAVVRNDQQQQQLLAQQQAQAQQQKADLAALLANPNAGPREYAAMTVKYPALREQFKQASDMLSGEQQKGELNFMTKTYAAVLAGRNDIAEQQIRDRAAAMRASGADDNSVKSTELWADLIKTSPEQARHLGGLMLAGVMGPEKFAETFGKLGTEQRAAEQAPGALRKVNADASAAEADAATKAVTAKFAEPQALKDLELKGWNVENIKSEIGYRKEANRIAAMQVALAQKKDAREAKELELKIQEAQTKLNDAARAKVADVESATSSIDNLINTVDRIKKNPALNDVLGSIEGRLPSVLSDNGADAIALIDTLGSQAFMSQIPAMKGTGALSEKEGDKLQSSLQNLSRTQSESQFRANLDEVQRLMLKARKNVETRYGIKATPPDTPAVQSTPQQIDDLVSKYLNPRPPGAR